MQIIFRIDFSHVLSIVLSVPLNQEINQPLKIKTMETTTTFNQHSVAADVSHNDTTSVWAKAEESRYGINMLVLGLVTIFGGMSAPYAVNLGDWQFAMVLFPSVFSLLLVLGLAPIRMIAYTAGFALVMNLIMFIAGALG